MVTFFALLSAGLLLGIRHASDADHIVAVSAIATRLGTVRGAVRVGLLWGLGHTTTILIVGGTIILLKLSIPARVGLSLEFAVALMLILLGVLNLRPAPAERSDPAATARPFIVGTVHGLAGSGGAVLLAVGMVDDARWATASLVIFCIGTIVGMMLITAGLAVPLARLGSRATSGVRVQRTVRLASGALSVAFGMFLAHRIGIVEGLFLGTMPRP